MKSDFPILDRLIYLDTAATAQKPQAVIDAISHFYAHEYGTVHRAVYDLAMESTEKYSAVRRKIASWIKASSEEEIVFTRGTTDALNLVARSLGDTIVEEGDEILITAMEHHSNLIPWQMLAERKKAKLLIAPLDERGDIDLGAFLHLLSPRTKIVSFTHVSNVLGTVNPIKEMVQIARRFNPYIVVDGAQGAPHLPVNVVDWDVDFYTFSGHKMYGPTGVGVLYGKKKILEMMPPLQGGGDMVREVTFEKATYQDPPLKFEAGTPMIASVIGLGAAIDYIEKHRHEEEDLLDYTICRLEEIPQLKIIGNPRKRSSLVSFTIEGLHPLDLGTFLSLKQIAIRTGTFCAQPLLNSLGISAAARISLGLYNTREDIDRTIEAILSIQSTLCI